MVGENRETEYMNRKTVLLSLLAIVVLLAGVPESFAHPQYIPSLTTVYWDSSCGACHVRASGGGPRNSYGTLFEKQVNHAADPAAALKAIGQPPRASSTLTPTATSEATASNVTTVTATVTPATAGFGIVVSLAGLFVCFLLERRNNK